MNPRSVLDIGAEFDAKQPSHGCTMARVSSAITINPSLCQQLNCDPVRDFAPVSLVAQLPNVIKDANIKVE